jgi:hypothetical protein
MLHIPNSVMQFGDIYPWVKADQTATVKEYFVPTAVSSIGRDGTTGPVSADVSSESDIQVPLQSDYNAICER